MKTILCVNWGDKYSHKFVEKLKNNVSEKMVEDYNFVCLTDKPSLPYHQKINLGLKHISNKWSSYENGKFWAWRKMLMFNDEFLGGDEFLYLDLDVIIHQNLDYFFELKMNKPFIVRGWWNDIDISRKNYAKFQSTPINSSVIRWNRGQLKPIYDHVNQHIETIFFTYPTIDNYMNHFWYDMHEDEDSFFNVYPKGDVYSWYKGNTFPDDMESSKFSYDHKICLFNNSKLDNKNEMLDA